LIFPEDVISIFEALKTVPPDATRLHELAGDFNQAFGPIFKFYQQCSSNKMNPGDKLVDKIKKLKSKIASLSGMNFPS